MARTLDDLEVAGKRVLVRADLNVPMRDGKISDATRITRQAPTIRELAEKGARVIVLSHFGRPKGKKVPEMSLRLIAAPLSQAVGRPVAFTEDCIGEVTKKAVAALKNGDVLLLENTRFHAGEEENDIAFAKKLAALGDIFVNDAFSSAHRAHASTEKLAHLLPAAAGRSMQEELEHLAAALERPQRPVMAVVGGAKISTKIALLEHLVAKVDVLVVGGAMANTFLAAQGYEIGKSLSENDQMETARHIMAVAKKAGVELVLPVDVVVAKEFKAHVAHRTVDVGDVARDEMILDVGPKSIEDFGARLQNVATLVWNGPFGAIELPPFDAGTTAAAKLVAERTRARALLSVAGGGDTVAALVHAGVADAFSYVSTAGGAFLEWLEGRTLPGVAALDGPDPIKG
ncbi:MAG: phosphoglycerate kinase [Proteobacteria bacterium]|nr:phosphoglycerate kinase [Pseudomonadota bacterium]